MFYTYQYSSPLGKIIFASDGISLTGLWFDGQKYFDTSILNESEKINLPVFEETKQWLDIYFSGRSPDFTPKLNPDGTPFRKSVWDILLTIPFGKTMTYGEIADRIALQQRIRKMSAQAVGGAVGHNPISIIIPCHRVIGSDGNLTGYAGGIDIKAYLLKMEKSL